jgi:hypothetical protein
MIRIHLTKEEVEEWAKTRLIRLKSGQQSKQDFIQNDVKGRLWGLMTIHLLTVRRDEGIKPSSH